MTIRLHRPIEKEIRPVLKNSTRLVRMRGRRWDPDLHPVVVTLGWPDQLKAPAFLATVADFWMNALLGSGYTVYAPFTGSNWGHVSNISPTGTQGTGYTAIVDAVSSAGDDGMNIDGVHLLGMSMGGCNALNWAWRNSSIVAGIYLIVPCVDLVGSYDHLITPPWNTNPTTMNGGPSMLTVYGAADRAALVTNCEANDPSRNVDNIDFGDRTKVFGVTTDEVIPAASLSTFCSAIGAEQYMQATGSHFFPSLWSDFDEYEIPAWFQTHS